MTILLVDDDPELRLIATFLLAQAGHSVVEAPDRGSALAACAHAEPDVVVMDVLLGEDDGIEVARAVLAACARPPRLVFLTGATREEQLARMRALAPAGILHKPFDPAAFPAQLAGMLERGR
jgi:CheY-like chemotaxis protein